MKNRLLFSSSIVFIYLLVFGFCCLKINAALISDRELPLYFLSSGLLSIIFGIGIPVEDLPYELVTSGLIVRAQYFLPNTPERLHHWKPLNIRGRSDTRWHLYNGIEMLIEKQHKISGKPCLLRSICEAAAVPVQKIVGGIYAEIVHIILTPSSTLDSDDNSDDYNNNSIAWWLWRDKGNVTNDDYLRAEQFGGSGNLSACAYQFNECPLKVLDQFTRIFDE